MLEQIRQRLSVRLPSPPWTDVLIAEDIDELTRLAGQIADTSAIVMPWRERAGGQSLSTGGHRQRVEAEFAIGIVVRQYDQMMGADRATRFDALKADIEAALAGWLPDGCVTPFELIGGESSPVTTGVSIFVQTWATARFLTGVPL